MLRVGQNTDRREKRPQNRQAEWQERDALQASPSAKGLLGPRVSVSRFDLLSTHHKISQMWEAKNLLCALWLPTQPPLPGGSSGVDRACRQGRSSLLSSLLPTITWFPSYQPGPRLRLDTPAREDFDFSSCTRTGHQRGMPSPVSGRLGVSSRGGVREVP